MTVLPTFTYKFEHRGKKFGLLSYSDNEQMAVHLQKSGTFFENETLDYIADNYPAQGAILDVGANVGNHSLYFASFLKYEQIFAFEPHPSNYELLSANLSGVSGFYPFNIALHDLCGTAFISTDKYNMGMCKISSMFESIQAPMRTVDTFALKNVTLMKIDTEGNEIQILCGAMKTIERCRPLIIIEVAVENFARYTAHMESIGYKLERHWKDRIVALYKPVAL